MRIATAFTLRRSLVRPLARGLEYSRQACHHLAIEVQVTCNRKRQGLVSSQTSIETVCKVCLLSMVENLSLAHISTLSVATVRRRSSKEGPLL
jgi:hypothetical protein